MNKEYRIVACFKSITKFDHYTGRVTDHYTDDFPTYEVQDKESGEVLATFDKIKRAEEFIKRGGD